LKFSVTHLLQLFFVWLAISLVSCSPKVQLEADQYRLYAYKFERNNAIDTETLESIIPKNLAPNNRPLNLPITPSLRWKSLGEQLFKPEKHKFKKAIFEKKLNELPRIYTSDAVERKKQRLSKKINRKQENLENNAAAFWRYVGEDPSKITEDEIKNTARLIEYYLFDKGFRDRKVGYRIDTLNAKKRKIKVVYEVNEHSPYLIDSVIYDVEDAEIEALLKENTNKAAIKNNDRFDSQLVDNERNRIELLTKNNGYYQFSNKQIQHTATNATGSLADFMTTKRGNLVFRISNLPNQSKNEQFSINEIVFKSVDTKASGIELDTINFNGIKFITFDKRIPLQLIDKRFTIRTGDIYSLEKIAETQRQIGLLNQFAFASYQLKQLDTNSLQLEFFAPTIDKYTFSFTPGLNNIYNSGNFFGFGVPLAMTVRNIMKRLETIELTARAAYEGQPSPINTNLTRYSLELGSNLSINFPSILLPFYSFDNLALQNPRTSLGVGFNYSEPFWGQRFNLNFKSNFGWQPSRFESVSFSLFDINLINTNYFLNDAAGLNFYNELVKQQALGNNLKVTLDPQFISSISANYLFNNQDVQSRYGNSKYLKIFVESGGTSLNFFSNSNQIGFVENLFPLRNESTSSDSSRAYFQFIKLNIDYRQYFRLTNKSGWAYRFNVGVINPYGANKSVPYSKNFFAGGSNSLRAWSPLSLGVGSAAPDVTEDGNVLPQPGDILLESSIEYRKTVGKLFGDLQLATFIDAGNTWKWHQIPTKPDKANFDFRRFYKEFAVGTGVGLRFDLTYFLARFDFGIKVIDPSQPQKERFVLDNLSLKKNSPFGLQFQFGIGYPF
jgi:outer membrane protein insertion porin family